MGAKQSKRSAYVWIPLGIIGLLFLCYEYLKRGTPQSTIRRVLRRYNIPEATIKQWIAVSAFETSGWTSHVFMQTDNLFNLIIPNSLRLGTGEGQTIFRNTEESVVALYEHVLKPFKYPLAFSSISDQVSFMKSKNYFISGEGDYLIGVNFWYNKLYSK